MLLPINNDHNDVRFCPFIFGKNNSIKTINEPQ